MKRYKLLFLCLVAVCLAGFTGCSDDDEPQPLTPFQLPQSYCECMLNGFRHLTIKSGSLDVSLSGMDNDVAEVTYNGYPDSNIPYGIIRIEGKKKGSFTLTATDNVTGEQASVEVKIVDTYLACRITEGNDTWLTGQDVLFFVADDARSFYLYSYTPTTDDLNSTPKSSGTYRFFEEENADGSRTPYLTLAYNEGETPVVRRFNLTESSTTTYSIIAHYLPNEWGTDPRAGRDLIYQHILCMQEEESGLRAQGELNLTPYFPEHVLE